LSRILAFDEHDAVLRCSGDEDRSTQGGRRRALTRALGARSDVVVDLANLGFADPSLMLDLVMLARRLHARGRALLLRCPQPQIERLIWMAGLHRLDGVRIVGPAPAFG